MLVRPASVTEDEAVEQEIRYARNGGVAIAYQVVGAGRVDLVWVPGVLGHSSIQTTGDVYADWDIDQLADTMRAVLEGEK
jgi:hypothetical protein